MSPGSGPESLSGRLLIAALTHLDRADAAERDVIRMAYLSDLENRLLGSLDSGRTRRTVAEVFLTELDAWTVVDVLEPDGEPLRLSIVHPDYPQPAIPDVLNTEWVPNQDEPIGYWAAARAKQTIVVEDVEKVLATSARAPGVGAALRALHVSACLVVPMWRVEDGADTQLIDGAITFMSTRSAAALSREEIAFAEAVTRACARALGRSRRRTCLAR